MRNSPTSSGAEPEDEPQDVPNSLLGVASWPPPIEETCCGRCYGPCYVDLVTGA